MYPTGDPAQTKVSSRTNQTFDASPSEPKNGVQPAKSRPLKSEIHWEFWATLAGCAGVRSWAHLAHANSSAHVSAAAVRHPKFESALLATEIALCRKPVVEIISTALQPTVICGELDLLE